MEFFMKHKNRSRMDLEQTTGGTGEHPAKMLIFDVLLAAALSAGCWYTFFSMFPNPVNHIVSIVLIAGLPVLMYFLCRNRITGKLLVFYVFIITAAFFMIFYKDVWNGFLVMANIVIEVLNNEFNAGLIPFLLTGEVADWSRDSLMAMIPVMILSATGIAYSVYNREPLLGFVLTAIPVLIGLCLKAVPSIWLLLLILLGWTGLIVASAVSRPAGRKKKRLIYIQSEKESGLPLVFIGITLVLLLGYVLIFSGDDYTPPKSVDEAKASVIQAEEYLRYEKITGDDYDKLSRGDLNDTHPLEYTDAVMLHLEMQMPQPMYLRGFTGGSFEDGKWTEAAEGAYAGEYTGAMEWLAMQDFYPWMQQERLYRMSENFDYVSVKVENVGASSKYMYLPYEAALTDDTLPSQVNYEKDYGAFMKGVRGDRDYTFTAFLARTQDYSEAEIASWLAEVKKNPDWDEYAGPEAVYRRYVYDTYLYMSEEYYELMQEIGAKKVLGKTISYTLHHIRDLFTEEYTYDIYQSAAPDGKGELEYFVSDSKTGNDMHFATVATLLFRSAGIPARYVEGYYLSPERMELYTEMSDVKFDVLDSDAHCWVEIYIDEVGWFPVEVIPGYFEMSKEETEEVIEEEDLKEETNRNFEDEAPKFDEPDKTDEDDKIKIHPAWFILLAVLLLIAAIEIWGRRRIAVLLASFGTVFTDAAAYSMYRYASRMMALDKHPLPADPYDRLEEISACYDGVTAMTFAEFLRLINRVRFGKVSLTEEEHKKMASYVKDLGNHVYSKQSKIKQFVMKFILFCV